MFRGAIEDLNIKYTGDGNESIVSRCYCFGIKYKEYFDYYFVNMNMQDQKMIQEGENLVKQKY